MVQSSHSAADRSPVHSLAPLRLPCTASCLPQGPEHSLGLSPEFRCGAFRSCFLVGRIDRALPIRPAAVSPGCRAKHHTCTAHTTDVGFLAILETRRPRPRSLLGGPSRSLSPGRRLPAPSPGRPSVCVCVFIAPSAEDTSPVESGPSAGTSF